LNIERTKENKIVCEPTAKSSRFNFASVAFNYVFQMSRVLVFSRRGLTNEKFSEFTGIVMSTVGLTFRGNRAACRIFRYDINTINVRKYQRLRASITADR